MSALTQHFPGIPLSVFAQEAIAPYRGILEYRRAQQLARLEAGQAAKAGVFREWREFQQAGLDPAIWRTND